MGEHPPQSVMRWRLSLLRGLLRFVLALGVVVAAPSIWFALRIDRIDIVAVDVAAVAIVAAITFVERIPYRVRALVLACTAFGLGVFFVGTVGVVGHVYLVAFPVLLAVLLGLRAAVVGLVFNAVTLVAVGASGFYDPQTNVPGVDGTLEWVLITVNFLFANTIVALPCAILLQRLERSLADEEEASASLAEQHAQLVAKTDELEREMQERQRMEERARRQDRLESLGTLATGIAHDVNNVLASILALAEMRRDRPHDDGLERDMELLVAAVQRASDIVRRVTVFGQGTDIDRAPIVLSERIAEIVPLLRAALPVNVTLQVDVADDAVVWLHAAEIDQLLSNLVVNAAQACGTAAGAHVAVRVSQIELDDEPGAQIDPPDGLPYEPGRAVELRVHDNGPGIPAEIRHRVFDPFFTTKAADDNSGLGLASVYAIVTGVGGLVDIEDTAIGASIRAVLPIAVIDDAEPTERADNAVLDPSRRHGTTILLVDDETLLLTITARALRNAGYAVVEAGDLDDAMRAFDDQPAAFDLVVTDVSLPAGSGHELFDHVVRHRADVPVLLTSGGPVELPDDDAAPRAAGLLAKPYDLQTLLAQVERLVGVATAATVAHPDASDDG